MQLFKRLARSLGYQFKGDPPEEFVRAYRETYKRWRYAPDTPVKGAKEKWLLIANRGGLFVGTEADFCATLAYMVGGSFGEVKFKNGYRAPVCQYKGWVCEAGIAPYRADKLATLGQVMVTFPIRNGGAAKALGYELLIQGK